MQEKNRKFFTDGFSLRVGMEQESKEAGVGGANLHCRYPASNPLQPLIDQKVGILVT
jgi:hypothetical protein